MARQYTIECNPRELMGQLCKLGLDISMNRKEVIKCQDVLNGLKRKAIKRGGALKGQSDVTKV